MARWVGTLRKIRVRLSNEIAKETLEVQKRISIAAANLEKKTGDLVLNSPRPTGLSAQQIQEYDTAIKQVAMEFQNQSAEFEKLAQDRAQRIEKEEQNIQSDLAKYAISSSCWKWPSQKELSQTISLLQRWTQSGKALQALAVNEMMHDETQPRETAIENYYRVKVGVLSTVIQAPLALRRLYFELKFNKQDSLVKEWEQCLKSR
jgi:hypothetical protein